MVTELPNSAEGLTKLLRSKGIQTDEIIDIVSRFSEIGFNFPNKEVFVIELIQDRWNDQKLINYKNDYKIWKLYNDMWCSIDDGAIIKKLFKNLKFSQLILQSTQTIENNKWEFLQEFYRTCTLINSEVTIGFTLDLGFKCLANILKLLCDVNDKIDVSSQFRNNIIEAVIQLTNLDNLKPEISVKVSNNYCETFLLPTLKYMVSFNSTNNSITIDDNQYMPVDITTEHLMEYLEFYLFNPVIDTPQQLEKFIKKVKNKIIVQDSKVLFTLSVNFLSKQKFKDLEKILILLTEVHPEILVNLLKELTLKKKSLSQEFLEALFQKTMENATSQNKYDETFWSLIIHILELDIEVGIKNTNELFALIETQNSTYGRNAIIIWKKLIDCYINAREYPNFLKIWADYAKAKGNTVNNVFISDYKFTDVISKNTTALSISQMNSLLSTYIDGVLNKESDGQMKLLLEVVLQGLKHISPTTLPEFKPVLSKVFGKNLNTNITLWRIRFLIMEVFDDIISKENIESVSSKDFNSSLKLADNPKDMFFYYFKLREYKVFKLNDIIETFITYLQDTKNKNEKPGILKYLFNNWSTLVAKEFSQVQIEALIAMLVSEDMEEVVDDLFDNDDFFEESEIISVLVQKLASKMENSNAIRYLTKIPIQCIQKNTRTQLIDIISSKSKITSEDLQLVKHLLKYPTFKSKIETDIQVLYSCTKLKGNSFQLSNPVFELVWLNHIHQIKDDASNSFINKTIKQISSKLTTGDKFYEMAYLVCKVSPSELVSNLQNHFIQQSLAQAKTEVNIERLTWILNCLFIIFKKVDNKISTDSVSTIKSVIPKIAQLGFEKSNTDLISITFLMYSTVFTDDLLYLFAHYCILRNKNILKTSIIEGIDFAVSKSFVNGFDLFNQAFTDIIKSFAQNIESNSGYVLELFDSLLGNMQKENTSIIELFNKSLSAFLTYCNHFSGNRQEVISVLKTLEQLLLSSPWLFTQYSIELLFPLCYKVLILFSDSNSNNDDIFISTTKIISKILLVHRVKLSKRNHLINNFFCSYLELVSMNENYGLTPLSAGALSRLISNFCEPSNISSSKSNFNREKIDSKISLIKRSLRKDAPILLIKYIHLSINTKIHVTIRKELTPCIYSIFDLLSRQELNLVNAILDSSGKQYFKSVYQDYTKMGKWTED